MKGFIEITDSMIAADPQINFNNKGLCLINVASILYISPYTYCMDDKTIIYLNEEFQQNIPGRASVFICDEDYETVKNAIEMSFA